MVSYFKKIEFSPVGWVRLLTR